MTFVPRADDMNNPKYHQKLTFFRMWNATIINCPIETQASIQISDLYFMMNNVLVQKVVITVHLRGLLMLFCSNDDYWLLSSDPNDRPVVWVLSQTCTITLFSGNAELTMAKRLATHLHPIRSRRSALISIAKFHQLTQGTNSFFYYLSIPYLIKEEM